MFERLPIPRNDVSCNDVFTLNIGDIQGLLHNVIFFYTIQDMAPKRGKPRKEVDSEEDGEDYRKKRDRNNMAVKRSRQKSKIKTAETMHRVNTLKSENTILQEKVKTLTKELGFLKELFLAHAGNSADKSKYEDVDLQQLLGDDPPSSETKGNVLKYE